jgi:hypothetical protein
VKDENCDRLADSHNNFNRWKNYFSQEIYTAEPLVPNPSPFEVENAIAKLNKCISPCRGKLVKAGGEILQSEIYKHINYILSKEELPDYFKESIILPIQGESD